MFTLPSCLVEISHRTLKCPKYCTVVAVFRPGDTFSLPLYSESGKRLYDGGFATGK